MARCGARHTSARPIVGIGPKSGLPLPPWLPHPSSRTPDAQYCRRPRPSPRSPGSLQRPSGALALRPSGPGPRLPDAATRLGTSLPPRLPAAGCSGVPARRRPRPPAFIPSSTPRRLPVSAAPRRAWVPRRLPGSLQRRGHSRQPPLGLSGSPQRRCGAASGTAPLIPLPLTPFLCVVFHLMIVF